MVFRKEQSVSKALILITFLAFLSSCVSEEEPEDQVSASLYGKWEQIDGCANSKGEVNYFNFNYTYGIVGQIDCSNACVGGGVYTNFNYTATGNSVYIDPYQVSRYCGVEPEVPASFNAPYSISGDVLTLDGERFRKVGSSAGGAGGGGGSTSDNGTVAFYTRKNNGCSAISITVDGGTTKNLSYYHPDGINDCTKGAIFDLSAGSHNFSAQCNSITWSGSFNISSGGCLIYELK